MAEIKDSGNRTEFASGAVRDIQEGKGRCDLLPLDIIADFFGMKSDCCANPHDSEVIAKREYYVSISNTLKDIYSFMTVDHIFLLCSIEDSKLFDGNLPDMMLEVAKHFEDGAKKYGERNWEKGIPCDRYIDSALRHYFKHLRGDTDERHDRAFIWNILCCYWTAMHHPELNPYGKNYT